MRKLLIAALAGGALFIAISFLVRAFESPETKIRRRLEQMAADFDGGRAGPCARGLAEEFVDTTTGAGVGDVHAVLVRMTFAERDPKTNEFLHRVAFPEDSMAIRLDAADPERATVDLVAVFEEKRGSEWKVEWRVAIAAEMAEGDDGWQVLRTTHETLEGARLH
jgi:hypothetical protein